MAIHFYILPIETANAGMSRGPKYFSWRYDPDPPGISGPWSMKDYGAVNEAVLAADVADSDHTFLSAQADVYAFPNNLDVNMPSAAMTALSTFLEYAYVPATNWLSGNLTYRQVLRTITALFFYVQRLSAILGYDPTKITGVGMNTQLRNMPADVQAAAAQAATDSGFSAAWATVKPQSTLRQILKLMADAWGTQPIYFGFVTL